jgi:hypothetical protein
MQSPHGVIGPHGHAVSDLMTNPRTTDLAARERRRAFRWPRLPDGDSNAGPLDANLNRRAALWRPGQQEPVTDLWLRVGHVTCIG